LDLYLKTRQQHPQFPAAEVRSAVRHALTVGRWRQSSQLDDILADIAHNRLSQALKPVTLDEQETVLYLSFLASKDSAWPSLMAEIAHTFNASTNWNQKQTGKSQENDLHFASSWGGVFLLLPTLIANRELMAAYGKVEDGALRYLLLGSCLGVSSEDWKFDRALALAAGYEETPEPRLLQLARPRTTLAIHDHHLLPEDFNLITASQDSIWPGIALEPMVRRDVALARVVLLRNFARRLPALGQSKLDYLWRNILCGDAVITTSPGQIVVELAPRALEIVLGMAGFREARFTPPWMAETEAVVRCGRQ
jgi:hypothetical protein